MTDKLVFLCLVLEFADGGIFSWSKKYVNVDAETIFDEVDTIVNSYDDIVSKDLHMQRHGFDENEDDHYYDTIMAAI